MAGSAMVVDGLGLALPSSMPGKRTIPGAAAAVVARFKRRCGESEHEREDAPPPSHPLRGRSRA